MNGSTEVLSQSRKTAALVSGFEARISALCCREYPYQPGGSVADRLRDGHMPVGYSPNNKTVQPGVRIRTG